jgi:hypothetical protein
VKNTTSRPQVEVTADGAGIVSHAGAVLLRELADASGLTAGWTKAVIGTYRGVPTHLPGRVLVDLAVTMADGGDCLGDLAALRDQEALFGPVASHPTSYRVLDRVGAVQLAAMRQARALAREHAWAAGAGPDRSGGLVLDVSAFRTASHPTTEEPVPRHSKLSRRLSCSFSAVMIFVSGTGAGAAISTRHPTCSGPQSLCAVPAHKCLVQA